MTGRKVVVSLSLLCALVLSAMGAANASAAGATAYTCKNTGPATGTFSDAHCLTDSPGGGYSHIEITPNQSTSYKATNRNTDGSNNPAVLTTTIAGVAVEIVCPVVHLAGKLQNVTPTPTTMQVHLTEGVKTYTECTVPKPVLGECVIKGGQIVTKKTTGTTVHTTEPKGIHIVTAPEAGETIAEVTFEKCKNAALNKTYPMTGSVIALPSGPTWSITPATSEKTLKFGGSPAKLAQILTPKMEGAGGIEEEGIALTTVQ
jgi:hypothetical protein